MEEKPDSPFKARFRGLVSEARGLLHLLQSVKGQLAQKAKDDKFYRMTLKRFRESGIRLASYADAYSLIAGTPERDALLAENGCTWDDAKKRVDLG